MESTAATFDAISSLLALLAAGILLWVNKEASHSKRMLALVLFILSIVTFNAYLVYSGWFGKYPMFHKSLLPASLLIAPASYLYVSSVLLGELKFRKYDWCLLIPAVLCTIDLLPYYLMPLPEKTVHVLDFYKNLPTQAYFNEGILPAYVFPFIRVLWSAVFIAINFKLINGFKKRKSKQVVLDNAILLRWLLIFNGVFAGILAAAATAAVIAPVFKMKISSMDIALAIFVVSICIQLFMRPQLLYGVFQPISSPSFSGINNEYETNSTINVEVPLLEICANKIKKTEINDIPLIIGKTDAAFYKKKIENLMVLQQRYLIQDYSLDQLVIDTQIHRCTLSAFINREYGMGFREFLNRFRVNYFKENLNKPEWENLTLEAIAGECGFTSRSTFIKNFKEITSQTPSEYIKNSHA